MGAGPGNQERDPKGRAFDSAWMRACYFFLPNFCVSKSVSVGTPSSCSS